MEYGKKNLSSTGKAVLTILLSASALLASQQSLAGPVHAFYADEHNTTATTPTGNKILEIDLDTMSLVNSLDVPGLLGHHADYVKNSKIYGVPKESNFVNVIELTKDQNGTTSMNIKKQLELIHKPRSGDTHNAKYNLILMAAKNRPMGSIIDVENDVVVATIGEDVDCTLTDGTQLLSHADANTPAGALKYQCVTPSHGGDQVSGHPYWLTNDYAAIVDRSNKQILVYHVWKENNQIKTQFLNSVPTRTSAHQIVPRDRTSLPLSQQADFYVVEEGEHVTGNDYSTGIPHALVHLRLRTNGLQFIRRMDLQRPNVLSKAKSDRILQSCINIYRSTFSQALTGPSTERERRYNQLFTQEGITRSTDQDQFNDFPVDCFYPGIPGGHNGDFAPNNKHLYIGMAGGAMSVVDVNRWKIANNIDIGIQTGPGHTCFSPQNNVALTSNHGFSTIFGAPMTRSIRYINSERPIGYYWIRLPFSRENITNTAVSHTCHVDASGDNYYNFYTDGGEFYKINMAGVFNNPTNGSSNLVVDSLYTGGIPIQASYINLDDIIDTSAVQFTANNDTAESDGSEITIDVLNNDTGNNLTLEEVDPASHGNVSIVNGQLKYTPNLGFSGEDSFWYGISSPSINAWEWALVTVTVTSSGSQPALKANADLITVASGDTTTIDVLANDTGTNIHVGWYDSPSNGTLTLSNNIFTYTSNPGFSGTEDFWYEIVDSTGQTTWGNIVITVTPSGQGTLPDANLDEVTAKTATSTTIDALANDTGTGLQIGYYDTPENGTLTVSNNVFTYTSNAGFTGEEDFWYQVVDAQGQTTWGNIVITVQP